MKSTPENIIRVFGMSNLMTETAIRGIQTDFGFNLGKTDDTADRDEVYYPQFDESIRNEARTMSEHYEIFYCLEKSIRQLINELLTDAKGENWWDTSVPPQVMENVNKNIRREVESGVTSRSTDQIDYTTFGELGEIIKHNWPVFEDVFNNKKAMQKIMSNLNLLRGPIAHCCELAEDEVIRLQLTVRDWFRLME